MRKGVGKELGFGMLVGNARKLQMNWNSSRKNDWNDAEMLAMLRSRSMYRPFATTEPAAS